MKHQHFSPKPSLKLLEVSVFVKLQLGACVCYIAAGVDALAPVLIGNCCVSRWLALAATCSISISQWFEGLIKTASVSASN